MERSNNEIIYLWSNVNEYRDRDSIDTMRILFFYVPPRCCCVFITSFSLSFFLFLFNTYSLTVYPLLLLYFTPFHLSLHPLPPLPLTELFHPPFHSVGYVRLPLIHIHTHSSMSTHIYTYIHTKRARAHTHLFENWCHEARGERKIHRYTYIDAGCTLTRLLSVCSRQLITTCASLGKYSVN